MLLWVSPLLYFMAKDIAIIHYNTPELTTALVQSIRKFSPEFNVTIFDNSDKRPFPKMDGVTIIDNTHGQLIDFKAMIESYPNRMPHPSNFGSEKHIASVDYLFDILTDGFILLDSDVLLKKDITPFMDTSVAWAGELQVSRFYNHATRLTPYCCWINVPMCKEKGIRFRHEGQFFKLSHNGKFFYDTGASFYSDCKLAGLYGKQISIYDYIIHFGCASWKKCDANIKLWLSKNKQLYTMEEKREVKKKSNAIPEIDEDTALIVIPYCSKGAQGRELEYAVEGWRKHFKEKYLIVLAGENHPVTETGDDICCIESPRVPEKEGQYRQHLDYVSCFKKVRAAFPKSRGFIFVADDCYAVNDFDMTDVKLLKKIGDKIVFDTSSRNGWQRDAARTRDRLLKDGYSARNYTTHLPQWYEWDKLEALWEKYDMENTSYVMEDLYYNIYYGDRPCINVHTEYQPFKCGVYRANPRIWYIEKALVERIWITNSPIGWVPALDKILSDYYGI